jgi:hypothetical protein
VQDLQQCLQGVDGRPAAACGEADGVGRAACEVIEEAGAQRGSGGRHPYGGPARAHGAQPRADVAAPKELDQGPASHEIAR